MLENYLLIAWRNLTNQKLFSFINIIGLALGMAACILTTIYVGYETSFDKQFSHSRDTYRITRHYKNDAMDLATTAAPFKQLLESHFSEIESSSLIAMGYELPLSRNKQHVNVQDMLLADSDIFDVLDLKIIAGDSKTPLNRVNTAVLTRSLAHTFFGKEDPIGKFVYINEKFPVEVTAIIDDLPENTHLHFSMLFSLESMRQYIPDDFKNWDLNYFYLYIKLVDGTNPKDIENRIPAVMSQLKQQVSEDQILKLQPITDIHLKSNYRYEMKANGRLTLVNGLIAIAIIIMLIACINYMNLRTAQATQRLKDIGVRKAVGASRQQLAAQYLVESFLFSAIACVLAICIVEVSFPWFKALVQREDISSAITGYWPYIGAMSLTAIVSVLAGSYPAFYLSSLKPTSVFNGQKSFSGGALSLRKLLVVIQFSTSVVLIIATMVVIKQVEFAKGIDPGYKRQNTVSVSLNTAGGLKDRHSFYNLLKERLEQSPLIKSVAPAQQLPTEPLRDIWSYIPEGKNIVADNMINLPTLNVGFGFFEHYNIELLNGRYFSETHGDEFVRVPTEEQPAGAGLAVVSESAARALGYTINTAVGSVIRLPFPPGVTNYKIVGVVKDIHFASLRDAPGPQVYHLVQNEERFVNIEIAGNSTEAALKFIDATWKELLPNQPITRTFLEDNFSAMYAQEENQISLLSIFSFVSILVSAMGLFGLSAFTTERRQKEIGIRKVMGASVFNIILLLTRDFGKLVIIGNLIAWPIAWLLMDRWLQEFTYAISLSADIFIIAGIMTMAIALFTTGWFSVRAAVMRPANSLQT